MIRKSGNRFSEKIMLNQRDLSIFKRSGYRFASRKRVEKIKQI